MRLVDAPRSGTPDDASASLRGERTPRGLDALHVLTTGYRPRIGAEARLTTGSPSRIAGYPGARRTKGLFPQ
jgi:hypothetical protein